jgi:hypothetical protein
MPRKIRLHKSLPHDQAAKIAEQTLTSRGIKPPEPGDTMPDGTKFAGTFRGKPIYAAPADLPELMDFETALKYLASLEECGRSDWRLPSLGELQRLYDNREKIGGFGGDAYWSSEIWGQAGLGGWGHNFKEGKRGKEGKKERYLRFTRLSVRCVRP